MPLYNIFSKITRKSKKPMQLPKIIADIHEKNSLVIAELVQYQNKNQIELVINKLEIGDYLIGNIILERKTTSDFISSMINKRLIQQLQQMQKYKQRFLIIEGYMEDLYQFQNSNSIRGFLLSILTNYQTPIIFTQDSKDTANYLTTLAKQQLKPLSKISLHSRIPKNKKEQKQYILESFPNIGPKKAEQLLKKFKTIKNTINAEETELKEILKSQAKDFKDLIDF